ncbi:hypothetical protein NMG60_11006444 [Bertholletia excelsa]
MGRSSRLPLLLVSALLVLSFSHGLGKNVRPRSGNEASSTVVSESFTSGGPGNGMILDYNEAGPNTNPKSGFLPPPAGQN